MQDSFQTTVVVKLVTWSNGCLVGPSRPPFGCQKKKPQTAICFLVGFFGGLKFSGRRRLGGFRSHAGKWSNWLAVFPRLPTHLVLRGIWTPKILPKKRPYHSAGYGPGRPGDFFCFKWHWSHHPDDDLNPGWNVRRQGNLIPNWMSLPAMQALPSKLWSAPGKECEFDILPGSLTLRP